MLSSLWHLFFIHFLFTISVFAAFCEFCEFCAFCEFCLFNEIAQNVYRIYFCFHFWGSVSCVLLSFVNGVYLICYTLED